MGGWVALDILAGLEGGRQAPFRWTDMGSMAMVGPMFAVADLRGLRFSGPIGWLVWGLAHLAFMPATENRITLLTKWLWQIGTRQRSSLLITGRPDQHINVEVGLERAEAQQPSVSEPAATQAASPAATPMRAGEAAA
jgi:NADH dehydrogenase